MDSRAWRFAGFAVAAALLWIFFLSLPGWIYVGSTNDDAAYILTAQSLLHGSYANPSLPKPTVFNRYGPGFPIFLAPWVRAFAPHWDRLRYVSATLTFLACLLLWRLSAAYFGFWKRVLYVGLFALHSLTLLLAKTVMSEPLFIALVLLFFVGLERQMEKPSWHRTAIQGFILGWAILVRPVGGLLIPSAALALGLVGLWREVIVETLIATAMSFPFLFFVYRRTGTPTDYLHFWRNQAPLLQAHLFDNVHRVSYLLFSFHLLGIHVPHHGIFIALSGVSILVGMAVCVVGFRELLRACPARKPLTLALGSYLGLLWLLHCFWLSIDPRYFWPLLIFCLLFFIAGISPQRSESAPLRTAKILFMGLWIGLLLRGSVKTLLASGPSPYRDCPAETFQWIRQNTPPSALLLAPEPLLYLYTQRRGLLSIDAADREEFRYDLLKAGIQAVVVIPFIVNMPLTAVGDSDSESYDKNLHWVASWPRAFRVAHRNNAEQTLVFEVVPSTAYLNAYADYLAAVDALQKGHIPSAQQLVRRSLAEAPDLAASWTAAGLAHYMQKDFSQAVPEFKRALAIEPTDALASLHLARIYAEAHDLPHARAYYAQTLDILSHTKSDQDLKSLAQAELARLPG